MTSLLLHFQERGIMFFMWKTHDDWIPDFAVSKQWKAEKQKIPTGINATTVSSSVTAVASNYHDKYNKDPYITTSKQYINVNLDKTLQAPTNLNWQVLFWIFVPQLIELELRVRAEMSGLKQQTETVQVVTDFSLCQRPY